MVPPVLGTQAVTCFAGFGVRGIERAEVVLPLQYENVCQAITRFVVERSPVILCAEYVLGHDAGQPF